MTLTERIQLVLIPIIGIVIWFLAPILPQQLAFAQFILISSVIILLQSLIRDIWLLFLSSKKEQGPKKFAPCMCIESTIGITGVILGLLFLGLGISTMVSMSSNIWSTLTLIVLSVGFLMKNYVIQWNPWRIRREKNHMNIVFRWKN